MMGHPLYMRSLARGVPHLLALTSGTIKYDPVMPDLAIA